MTTPKLALSLTLLVIQAALLSTGIYLLIKAERHARAARHHPTPTAYWQHRAKAGDTRTIALFLFVASFAISHLVSALTTD